LRGSWRPCIPSLLRVDLPEISWFNPADYWLGTRGLGAIKKRLVYQFEEKMFKILNL